MRHKKQKNPSAMGQIRIISGRHRGRKLAVIDSSGLRPTTDRTKETLFNWLQGHIVDAVCLDAFAGSGSLTFEAASRGARQVIACELNRQACRQLQQNISILGLAETVSVYESDALKIKAENLALTRPFDIVFVDPPFNQGLLVSFLQHLFEQGLINVHTLVYCEHEPDLIVDWAELNLSAVKSAQTSGFIYGLYQLNS
ncbi:MAG: 16S rRNA (guanine(966)-N(2))-methyltransferase RsmD [Alteromonadaceae bacterium]|nr:16S rRNA (guanine(966)-N(2))-methyltransferase RsmD [Alteromonadaceae bacterium]